MHDMFKRECEEVKRLGEQIGYGNMMSIASHLWAKKLIDSGVDDEGACYMSLLSNMKDSHMTEAQKEERKNMLELFELWGF